MGKLKPKKVVPGFLYSKKAPNQKEPDKIKIFDEDEYYRLIKLGWSPKPDKVGIPKKEGEKAAPKKKEPVAPKGE